MNAEAHPFDLVIVGGGPAGMSAALRATRAGLSVAVIDEQARPGGQIGRQPPAAFRVDRWQEGRAYRALHDLLAAFEAEKCIRWIGGRSVIGLSRERAETVFRVELTTGWRVEQLFARRVLIATGCYDLPVPLPGWTLPGVMAAGGVQAFLKSQQIVPGDRFVFAGTHPLMLVVAAQVAQAGGDVVTIAFEQTRAELARGLASHPLVSLRNLPTIMAGRTAEATLRKHGVAVRYGLSLESIEGRSAVEAARFAGAAPVPADQVALCYGFMPQSDLPRLAGACVTWAEPAGGWRTIHDDWMRTTIAGLFVAGETGGVAGANAAMAEGSLAALGVLIDAGMLDGRVAEREARPIRRRLHSMNAFAAMFAKMSDPRAALAREVPPETILCRCEEVRYAQAEEALAEVGEANAVKLATRIGMGLCQGRGCEASMLRLLVARQGKEIEAIAGFTARFPIRPVRIGDLLDPIDVALNAKEIDTQCD